MGIFDGKVAIITGAARGLGRQYARFFAEDGASVVLGDINGEGAEQAARELVSAGYEKALGLYLDVTAESSAQHMAEQAMQRFGRIDILVNNAGIWGDLVRAPLLTIDPDYWDTVMAVNLKGALLCSRAVVPIMRQQGRGRIINISSNGAYKAGSVYSISKLALNQLTYSLAAQVADFGITCNGIAPGPILTEATQRQYSEQELEEVVQQNMIKRAGTGRDLYGAIRYLCSDDADWVTGQTIYVNGGSMSRF
jgi:NAD(P)-dependent dehydrogenase (short-subunit alcohol dehydrogenase family)